MLHIDTTKLSMQELRNILFARLSFKAKTEFTVSFMSFGFKHGVPIDADIIIDVRFLPNPYYVDELKNKTGDDQEVYDYVMKFDETKEFCRRLHDYIDFVLKEYAKQKRSHLTIAVGCTGGHHRSVTIANWLYGLYKDRYQCFSRTGTARCKIMKNVVIIGGGTGLSVMLRGMKTIPGVELSAIVTVADDGGSTGRLRDSYQIPGHGRYPQCHVRYGRGRKHLH